MTPEVEEIRHRRGASYDLPRRDRGTIFASSLSASLEPAPGFRSAACTVFVIRMGVPFGRRPAWTRRFHTPGAISDFEPRTPETAVQE
jgi:hypothetical protein